MNLTYQQLTDAQLISLLNNPRVVSVITILAIWALVWKGLALWKAARNGSKVWYIVMLVVNTVGILEIVYFFFFSKKKEQ